MASDLNGLSYDLREKMVLIAAILSVAVELKKRAISVDEIYGWCRQAFVMIGLTGDNYDFAISELARRMEKL